MHEGMHNIVRSLSLQAVALRLLKQAIFIVQILKHLPLPGARLLDLLELFRRHSLVLESLFS
jgi:hypothetical protein